MYGQMMTLMILRKFISMIQKTIKTAAVLRLRRCHIKGGKLRIKNNGAKTARTIPWGMM
jgi:hypothetical protein